MSTFRRTLATVAILYVSAPSSWAQQPAESMSRFHASVRVSTPAGLVAHGPALSEDLPTPGFANRWHYIVGPQVADVLRDLVGQAPIYHRSTVVATTKGQMIHEAEGIFRLEFTPANAGVAATMRKVAESGTNAETLWQYVTVRPAADAYARILIEEPSPAAAAGGIACAVQLEEIQDPRPGIEDSRLWFQVRVGDCGEAVPTWSVTGNDGAGWIEAWHRDKSGKTAWLGGPFGRYRVTVEVAGITDSLDVEIRQ